LESAGADYDSIDTVYLAGGIGQFMNVNDAAYIGLLPQEVKDKTYAIGNSSLGGAVRVLLSPTHAKENKNKLLSGFTELKLAEHPRFNDLFAENMLFPI
jgi:uncharacterized 2Fe-2S/4Fe-4S cluster protein (DUF4445 family)